MHKDQLRVEAVLMHTCDIQGIPLAAACSRMGVDVQAINFYLVGVHVNA